MPAALAAPPITQIAPNKFTSGDDWTGPCTRSGLPAIDDGYKQWIRAAAQAEVDEQLGTDDLTEWMKAATRRDIATVDRLAAEPGEWRRLAAAGQTAKVAFREQRAAARRRNQAGFAVAFHQPQVRGLPLALGLNDRTWFVARANALGVEESEMQALAKDPAQLAARAVAAGIAPDPDAPVKLVTAARQAVYWQARLEASSQIRNTLMLQLLHRSDWTKAHDIAKTGGVVESRLWQLSARGRPGRGTPAS